MIQHPNAPLVSSFHVFFRLEADGTGFFISFDLLGTGPDFRAGGAVVGLAGAGAGLAAGVLAALLGGAFF